MELKAIQAFDVKEGRLTFQGQPLAVKAAQPPYAQFQSGDRFLLFLPGDLYAEEIFEILLLNARHEIIEAYSAPLPRNSRTQDPRSSIQKQADGSICLVLDKTWRVSVSEDRKYRPREAFRRIQSGWTGALEMARLMRASHLRIF